MDKSKRQATAAQLAALEEFMQEHTDAAQGLVNTSIEKDSSDSQWKDLAATLNSMGGAVKSVKKWKQTWHDLKSNRKKRPIIQVSCDTSVGTSSEVPNNNDDNYRPPNKRYVKFDEEIITIEREKLDLDRDYKAQKIEVLSRIASALEELAKKKETAT